MGLCQLLLCGCLPTRCPCVMQPFSMGQWYRSGDRSSHSRSCSSTAGCSGLPPCCAPLSSGLAAAPCDGSSPLHAQVLRYSSRRLQTKACPCSPELRGLLADCQAGLSAAGLALRGSLPAQHLLVPPSPKLQQQLAGLTHGWPLPSSSCATAACLSPQRIELATSPLCPGSGLPPAGLCASLLSAGRGRTRRPQLLTAAGRAQLKFADCSHQLEHSQPRELAHRASASAPCQDAARAARAWAR